MGVAEESRNSRVIVLTKMQPSDNPGSFSTDNQCLEYDHQDLLQFKLDGMKIASVSDLKCWISSPRGMWTLTASSIGWLGEKLTLNQDNPYQSMSRRVAVSSASREMEATVTSAANHLSSFHS